MNVIMKFSRGSLLSSHFVHSQFQNSKADDPYEIDKAPSGQCEIVSKRILGTRGNTLTQYHAWDG